MTFQKGQSGNPGGKPKGTISFKTLLLKKLAEKGPNGKKKADAVADELITLALTADLDAIKVLLDRIDGKVVDKVEHSGSTTVHVVRELSDDELAAIAGGGSPGTP